MGARKAKKIDTTVTSVNPSDIAPIVTPPTLPGDGLGIVISKRDLKVAIGRFTTLVDRKSTMPILANVSLRVDHGGLTVTGTDLNLSMRVKATCSVGRTGSVSIPVKKLADAIKTLPDGDVRLYGKGSTGIVLESGSATVQIDGISDRDTPRFPALADDARWISLPSQALCDAFEATQHAICRDETRFHLNGTLFEIAGKTMRVVATDGHRLTTATRDLDGEIERVAPVIVPRKGVVELGKFLDGKTTCDIARSGAFLWLRQGEATLVIKLIDAQFPPWEQVVPKDHKRLIVVDGDALADSLGRAKVNCDSTHGAVLSLASGKLTVSAGKPGESEMSETLDAEFTCDPITFCFNPAYMIDALKQIAGRVVLAVGELHKPHGGGKPNMLDPIIVRSVDDAAMRPLLAATLLGVVMPMRM